jgi:hypothetical protein
MNNLKNGNIYLIKDFMPITCKWSWFGIQQEAKFETVEAMMKHESYYLFNYIRMDNCKATYIPELPRNLEILSFSDNKIFELPNLPVTLHSLYGKNNRLSKFPDISKCLQLEDVELEGNDIEILDSVIPANVKTVNLNFNKLKVISYEKIDPSLKLSVSYNFLTKSPPNTHKENIVYDHNEIKTPPCPRIQYDAVNRHQVGNHGPWEPTEDNINIMARNTLGATINNIFNFNNFAPFLTIAEPITRIVGTDAQSVHESSIQKSANDSLDYILNYSPQTPVPNNYVSIIKKEYYNYMIRKSTFSRVLSGVSYRLARAALFGRGSNLPLEAWCLDNSVHSIHGVTYNTLLGKIWGIIMDHEHKEAMKEVLFDELKSSIGVCFTGRFTRAINSLTGFVDAVKIGINSKEQMHNQIAMAINKAKKKYGATFQEEARKDVKIILTEFEVPGEEHDAWLDAIE